MELSQGCQHVQITGCTIGTGDDCIAILTNTSDVDITRITCGPGHGIRKPWRRLYRGNGGRNPRPRLYHFSSSDWLKDKDMAGRIRIFLGSYFIEIQPILMMERANNSFLSSTNIKPILLEL